MLSVQCPRAAIDQERLRFGRGLSEPKLPASCQRLGFAATSFVFEFSGRLLMDSRSK